MVEATGIRFDEILGTGRRDAPSKARFIATHLFKQAFPHWTFSKIARVMIRKDHSAVMHGIKRAVTLIESNQPFRAAYDRALSILTTKQ